MHARRARVSHVNRRAERRGTQRQPDQKPATAAPAEASGKHREIRAGPRCGVATTGVHAVARRAQALTAYFLRGKALALLVWRRVFFAICAAERRLRMARVFLGRRSSGLNFLPA